LRPGNPTLRFRILGFLDVENRTAIKGTTVEGWVAEGAIEFLGTSGDVRPHIAAADCVVLPSYREGTSRVLLEAAAMARPLVATDVPGCREVVDDGVTGFLCAPRDAVDLAAKLARMAALSDAERTAMGAAGRAKVMREFDQSIVIARYLEALDGLPGRHGSARV
jgi:glycosyltransferase involved in cell wall biosynthesis